MKVIQLTAENVKRLKAVDITPEDDMIIISGKNGQGKTSVLDSIWLALGGADAIKKVAKPIREGAKSAKSRVDLGDLIVTRTWTEKGSYLKVETKDGAEYRSPQALLDKLIGKLSFDPLAFANTEDKKRREILLDLVNLGIDLDAWEKERTEVYSERTGANKEVVKFEAQVAGVGEIPEDTPDEEISPATVLEEQAQAQAVKEQNDARRRSLEYAKRDLADWEKELEDVQGSIAYHEGLIENLRKQETELNDNISVRRVDVKNTEKNVAGLVDPDLTVFEAKLEEVERLNRAVRVKKHKVALSVELAGAKQKAAELTDRLKALDKLKTEALAGANFPIDGLGISEDGVTFQGIPFSQCSDAERLKVSLAIAMALNPKIRVLRITNGSLLDSDNLAVIREMIKAHDFQLWIERVADDGKVGVVIEDGEVVQ